MISKQQLAASMARECDISRHLFAKLRPEALSYRPSPGQRTTMELLGYLAVCGIAGIRCMAERDWKLFGEFKTRTQNMSADAFPALMDRQKAEIEAFFNSVSEEVLDTQDAPLPGGGTQPLGVAILNGPFKWLTAYKMQLFLYAKATGATEIGTANVWAGIDWQG